MKFPDVNKEFNVKFNEMILVKTGEGNGQGADDFSPVAKVEQTEEGANITITDKYGTTQATIKHGEDGLPGAAGTSVTVKNVSESTADGGSNVVTFSDGKTVTIKNGSKGSKGDDGYAPKKGTDYFTEADKAELVTDVLNALPTWQGGAY